jgi:GxxExxY protein
MQLSRVLQKSRPVSHQLNALTETIIGAAIEVHRELGPGMLECAYERCLALELLDRWVKIERQKSLPLTYKAQLLNYGYRLDRLVEDAVVVEVKSIEKLERVHMAQLLSYLRFSGCHVGLLMNFNVAWLTRDAIRRVVLDFPE